MAPNKEKLVLLLDVGPSMHPVLSEVETLCSMLLMKKLISKKDDEVGVVVFGTQETHNALTKEVGGFNNITLLQDIKLVDGGLVDTVQNLPRGTVNVDFFGAIIVGMDMLIKRYKDIYMGKKRLCLITNAIHPIEDSLHGTREGQVRAIAEKMTEEGMKLESIVIRGRPSQDTNKRTLDENDHLLSILSEETRTHNVYVDGAISLLGAIKTRQVTPATVFRGFLEISPQMKIKVWVYKKTQEEKFPTLKRYSEKASASGTSKSGTGRMKVDYEYRSVDDSGKVVPPEQRIKGYRYGPHAVPISGVDLDAVKFVPKKGVKLLCFTDASNILRHYYMKDVYCFVPEPGNTRALLAVSAIARAMKEMNKVAILRCVWRQGQKNVVVGVLTPNFSQNNKIPDSFYFNILPFEEDVREYHFPSFKSFPASCQPNEQQQKAADEFVQMLSLAPSDKEEALMPEFTPNPVLEVTKNFIHCQRFYRHLDLKSKQSYASVPPIHETLKRITEPDAELFSDNKFVVDAFVEHFNNTKVQEVEKVGDLTPVQDFEAMMSRRNKDWTVEAIREMRNKILHLLKTSNRGDNYLKAVICITVLREGCIIAQDSRPYNNLLRYLKQHCQEKGSSSFLQLLASRELTLLSKSHAANSDATDDEVRSFFRL